MSEAASPGAAATPDRVGSESPASAASVPWADSWRKARRVFMSSPFVGPLGSGAISRHYKLAPGAERLLVEPEPRALRTPGPEAGWRCRVEHVWSDVKYAARLL